PRAHAAGARLGGAVGLASALAVRGRRRSPEGGSSARREHPARDGGRARRGGGVLPGAGPGRVPGAGRRADRLLARAHVAAPPPRPRPRARSPRPGRDGGLCARTAGGEPLRGDGDRGGAGAPGRAVLAPHRRHRLRAQRGAVPRLAGGGGAGHRERGQYLPHAGALDRPAVLGGESPRDQGARPAVRGTRDRPASDRRAARHSRRGPARGRGGRAGRHPRARRRVGGRARAVRRAHASRGGRPGMIRSVADFIRYFEGVRRRTWAAVDGITPPLLDWRPRAGEWTCGGIVRHLAGAERFFVARVVDDRWTDDLDPGPERDLAATRALLAEGHAREMSRLATVPDA